MEPERLLTRMVSLSVAQPLSEICGTAYERKGWLLRAFPNHLIHWRFFKRLLAAFGEAAALATVKGRHPVTASGKVIRPDKAMVLVCEWKGNE
jgi:hypothetical protein